MRECHRVLKNTGSIWVHLDQHASHYIKVEMDEESLFGESNFHNEVIWKRRTAHSDKAQGAKHLGAIHDTLLFYTKSDKYTWHPQYVPYSESYATKGFPFKEKETGRYYQLNAITGPGGAAKGNPHYEFLGVTRYWRFKKETMEKLYSEGRIVQTKPGNVPRQKRYLDEMPGVELQDIWLDIKPVSNSKEDLGYPTQKPLALLERIESLSSDPTDIVLDPFCGCGTAIAAAHRLGRRWIGIDVSPTACKLMAKRMRSIRAKVNEIGLPRTAEELKTIQPFEFQNWVFERLHGRVNPKKVADMGIDGWVELNIPVQVKQSEGVGRKVVDEFETSIKRFFDQQMNVKGVVVGFSFTKDAYDEVARAKLKDNVEVRLLTVEEILKTT